MLNALAKPVEECKYIQKSSQQISPLTHCVLLLVAQLTDKHFHHFRNIFMKRTVRTFHVMSYFWF